jgi:hypothetical protein
MDVPTAIGAAQAIGFGAVPFIRAQPNGGAAVVLRAHQTDDSVRGHRERANPTYEAKSAPEPCARQVAPSPVKYLEVIDWPQRFDLSK